MARIITFSTSFPKGHPRAGQPTWFIEALWKHFYPNGVPNKLFNEVESAFGIGEFWGFNTVFPTIIPKIHTIRRGHRWKAGDHASLRVWSGKPYNSKQVVIVEHDVEIVKTYKFRKQGRSIFVDGKRILLINATIGHGTIKQQTDLRQIAQNDGLSLVDFMDWFNKPNFSGQIICFSDPQYK